jgi:hypothetical protein
MRALLVALLLLGFWHAQPCGAQDGSRELRLGGGWDVRHKPGMVMGSLAMDPFSLFVWDEHLNFGLGLSHRFGSRTTGWSASLGGIAVRRTDEDLGTHLNFLLEASHCGEALCLSYAHLSHGALLGIERGASNSGLNFVFLEYRLR